MRSIIECLRIYISKSWYETLIVEKLSKNCKHELDLRTQHAYDSSDSVKK